MAVRRAVGGIAVGGEAAIAGSRLAGWLGRTMARPYYVGEEGRWGWHCCGSPWRVACEGRWGGIAVARRGGDKKGKEGTLVSSFRALQDGLEPTTP